jgi:outer membrane protein assembly factor BamB
MRFLRWVAVLLVVLFAAGAVAYWGLGIRPRLDGTGKPVLRKALSATDQARMVEAHRASQKEQRSEQAAPSPQALTEPAPKASLALPKRPAAVAERTRGDSAYWTGFRGPFRDGHYREQSILTSWPPDGLKPVWKQPLGGGYASFAIAHGRAFTIEQRRDKEVVASYDVKNGRELWTHGWAGEFREWMGGDGPRATPTWADGRVYALGALGELRCLEDATGRLIWRVNILQDNGASNLPWGMAASPLVYDDLVVVLPGGPRGLSVVAYDRTSGKRRWSVLDDKQAYSSPMLVKLNGRRQLLVLTGTRLVALVPESGELLWEFPWQTSNDINASQPVVIGDNRLLLSSSYGHGAAVIEVTAEGDRQSARQIWAHTRLKNRFSSSVLHEGFIYGLDENVLTCLDAAAGDVKWKAGRYGHGQFVLAQGHLIVLSEEGELALVRATPAKHEELVRFPVLEGKTWNHPAISEGVLLVRNLAEMAAFDLRVRRR